jgi:hypothetical protein
LRIVHAANYQFKKDGTDFANWDLKIHQGLVQAGHYVYPFSVSDQARMRSITGHRDFGLKAANTALVRTCVNIHPDILMLGHAQSVTRVTLEEIRKLLPEIRIALWYGDAIWEGMGNAHLFERMPALDAMFISTGGDVLEQFAAPGRVVCFVPNPVESSIECHKAFDCKDPEHDVIFFGRDDPGRNETLRQIIAALPELRFAIFGCLGKPLVQGHAREQIVARSRMALNLSRNNTTMLCSSNRLSDTVGNGVLTFCDAANGLDPLFTDDEVVYYKDVDELVEKIRYFNTNNSERIRIAANGWRRMHACYSSEKVARYMVEVTCRMPDCEAPSWPRYRYGD